MQIPKKFLSYTIDPSQINQFNDLLRGPKKFDLRCSPAQVNDDLSEIIIEEGVDALQTVQYFNYEEGDLKLDTDNKSEPYGDARIVGDLGSLQHLAIVNPTFDPESIENANSISHEKLTCFFVSGRIVSDSDELRIYTQATSLPSSTPTSQSDEKSLNFHVLSNTIQTASFDKFTTSGSELHFSDLNLFSDPAEAFSVFKRDGAQSFVKVSKVQVNNDLGMEKLDPLVPFVTSSRNKVLSPISIVSSLKADLKASLSMLCFSTIGFDYDSSSFNDLENVIQRLTVETGNSSLKAQQQSVEFFDQKNLYFKADNNHQSEQKIIRFDNLESERAGSDNLRQDNQPRLSNLMNGNAHTNNEHRQDKLISVDAPHTQKLDMSQNSWQKIFKSRINKAAIENITRLQFSINPKKLGNVSVSLQMNAGEVSVTVISSSGHVANILQASEAKLETLLSDNGMKLASYTVNSEQNGRERRDRAPTQERKSALADSDLSQATDVTASELRSKNKSAHTGDYDYLV